MPRMPRTRPPLKLVNVAENNDTKPDNEIVVSNVTLDEQTVRVTIPTSEEVVEPQPDIDNTSVNSLDVNLDVPIVNNDIKPKRKPRQKKIEVLHEQGMAINEPQEKIEPVEFLHEQGMAINEPQEKIEIEPPSEGKAKREKAEYMREYRKAAKALAETEKQLLKELENKVNDISVNYETYSSPEDAINTFKPNLKKKTIKKPLKINTYGARYDRLIADIA